MTLPKPWILCEPYAGLRAQAQGLAEAAGLSAELRDLAPRVPWRWFAAASWPAPLAAVPDVVRPPFPPLAISCGGVGAAVGAALRRRGVPVVQVQHPRMDRRKFDLIVVNRHDALSGPNVIVTRTALHLASPQRLAAARVAWAPILADLPRPLVAVLLGGSNGRFRLDETVARGLAVQCAEMARLDGVGLAVTPSRRTGPAATRTIAETLRPCGAYVWDGTGENPYFGLLALADAIVVTVDSVSMISEAVATSAPVMLAALPGRSRRNSLFTDALLAEGRVRRFAGRLELWQTAPLDDTEAAAAEMRRRLRL